MAPAGSFPIQPAAEPLRIFAKKRRLRSTFCSQYSQVWPPGNSSYSWGTRA